MKCCARCGREVYHAEQKSACNQVWHTFCFSCYKCRKLLDYNTLNTFQGELFCDSCYKACDPSIACTTDAAQSYGDRCRRVCKPLQQNRSCCKKPNKQLIEPNCCCKPRPACGPCRTEVICAKPLHVKTNSRHRICNCQEQAYTLNPVRPKKKCATHPVVVMEHCPPPVCSSGCKMCCQGCCIPKDCRQRPCTAMGVVRNLSIPIPRETSSYYNRNHTDRPIPEPNCNCEVPYRLPPGCCCRRCKQPKRVKSCRTVTENCPPKNCCPKKFPTCSCCCPNSKPPSPCSARVPYCPPQKQAVCYPPLKCSTECPPCERILYCPRPEPPQPRRCPCGLPNPCDCNLNYKKKVAICCATPCCRRCGEKVYAAERIVASGGSFHSCCFSCYCCNKSLEVTNVFENQGEIYCKCDSKLMNTKDCYARFFGVTGYGYGSTLQTLL